MSASRTKPSLTSLVAFFLIVLPFVYLLALGPIVYMWDDLPPSARDAFESSYAWVGELDEDSLIGRLYIEYMFWCYELGNNQS